MKLFIRDILWLTAVIAIGCGWYADTCEYANRTRQLERWGVDAWTRVIKKNDLEDCRFRLSVLEKSPASDRDRTADHYAGP
jgi:hypothetical protein